MKGIFLGFVPGLEMEFFVRFHDRGCFSMDSVFGALWFWRLLAWRFAVLWRRELTGRSKQDASLLGRNWATGRAFHSPGSGCGIIRRATGRRAPPADRAFRLGRTRAPCGEFRIRGVLRPDSRPHGGRVSEPQVGAQRLPGVGRGPTDQPHRGCGIPVVAREHATQTLAGMSPVTPRAGNGVDNPNAITQPRLGFGPGNAYPG